MSLLQLSKKEIEECQEIVNNFRVNELHLLLTSYHYPKLGKKQDLVSRAQSILANPKYQLSAVQKVREIQATNRIRSAAQPYLSNNMQSSSNSGDLIRRQQYQSGAGSGQRSVPMHPQHNAYQNYHAPNAYGAAYNNPQQQQQHFQHQQPPNMNQFGHHRAPSVPSAQAGQLRNLQTVVLPFYNVRGVIHQLTEMQAFSVQPRPGEARITSLFGMSTEDIPKLLYKNDNKPLPRFEIQLRMFQLDNSGDQQQDAFPPGCVVKNIIPTNKPNAEQKRQSRPVDLTPFCQAPRGKDRPHKITIEWAGDKRAWAFGIYLVYHVNAAILQERLLMNETAKRAFDVTKAMIIKRLRSDEDEGIQMDTLKISLICPLMKTRIKIPSRPEQCTHLQCFDLTNYLMMSEKKPVWKCPVCDNNAAYSKLIVDEYFQRLLNTVGSSVEEVELLKDGTWRVVQEEEVMDLSDEDNECGVVASSSKNVKKSTSVVASSKGPEKTALPPKEVQDDVITLSDSDNDEDELPANMCSATARENSGSASNGSSSAGATTQKSSSPATEKDNRQNSVKSKPNDDSDNSSENSIICLGSDEMPNGAENRGTDSATVCRDGSASVQQQQRRPQQQHLSYNGGVTPVLQTNGFNPPVFRPIIDEVAKTKVAQELANFLQTVCQKNSVSNSA
uniref:Uncharacterized protein n=1 Tax=Ditylenchus dipsaci TaxID=166011 RepID=A0A915DTB5_9BILA